MDAICQAIAGRIEQADGFPLFILAGTAISCFYFCFKQISVWLRGWPPYCQECQDQCDNPLPSLNSNKLPAKK